MIKLGCMNQDCSVEFVTGLGEMKRDMFTSNMIKLILLE